MKTELYDAFNEWYNLFKDENNPDPLNNLSPHNNVFADYDGNGSLYDDMVDYFVDEFLDLSGTEST